MEKHSVETIVQALNAANVRYLVVGGLAVVAHGYVRFTADVDLIVDLEPANLTRAIAALGRLGYRPRAPVGFEEFADSKKRAQWVRDKGLTVFSLYSLEHPLTEVDLFVEPPFDFSVVYRRAARTEIAPGVEATFIGLRDLVRLKREAARPQDLLDLERLRALRKEELDE
jgi:predicted nucleotidyltransferase